jgi:hypothetical protein
LSLIGGLALIVVVAIFGSNLVESEKDKDRQERIASVEKMRPPKLVIEKSNLDFGRIEPNHSGTCGVVIRNAGERRLELGKSSDTTKELEVHLGDDRVREGETIAVNILWKPEKHLGLFTGQVVLTTNDPEQPQVTLQVKGIAGTELAFEPVALAAGEIPPHQTKTVSAMLYSNAWDDLEIEQVEPLVSEAKWTIEDANAAEADKLLAKWAKVVRVEIPAGLTNGPFNDTLRAKVKRRTQPSETRTCELPIHGRVLRRLAVYGEIDPRAVVDVGKIEQGNAKRVRLTLKVRDEQLDLPVKKIIASPEFLKVNVKRYEAETLGDGLYHLDVEVPADAPLCTYYLDGKYAEIHLEFDHPRIKELNLKAAFMVNPKF